MKLRSDIVVVGAGPSGLHTARLLAENGFSVIVLEEHNSSGAPVHCTGILAAEAFDEFDLPRSTILNELHTVRVISPSGIAVSYTPAQTEAVVIDRLQFDQELNQRAVNAGAEIMCGNRALSVDIDNQCVKVETQSGQTIEASGCVLACGASYALQLRLGMGLPERYLKSAQIEMPARNLHDVEIYLGSATAPQGFGWAVPVVREDGTYCRIGLMCEGDAESYFGKLCERVSGSWGVDRGDRKPRVKLLPLASIAQTFGHRMLIIGDAAGRVKPSTGGGIYYSLVSAQIAAETLCTALRERDLSASSLERYEQRWRDKTGPEIEAQTRLRVAVQQLSDRQIDELVELARIDGILPLVRATARFNEHREFIAALMKHPEARRILFDRLAASFA